MPVSSKPVVRRTAAAALSAVLLFLPLGYMPALALPPAAKPKDVAQAIWSKLLAHCGESYFYAGSPFDGSGMLSDVQVAHQKVMEYRRVKFNIVPIRVTDAERANGIAYRGRVSMIAHMYRQTGEDWQDGLDRRARNMDDIVGNALAGVGSDLFDMGSNGAIALELVKYKGDWAVTRSSATSSSSIGFGSHFFDVGKLLDASLPRYDCASSSVMTPQPAQKPDDPKPDDGQH